MDYGKAHYDYVIIDTPPVSIISDAIVLMKMADVNIFVMNTKYPFRESLNMAEDIFKVHNPSHFCLILNNVKKVKSNYYYRRYGAAYRDYTNIKT
jgi:Mrp family chromosome partitioning ATPase